MAHFFFEANPSLGETNIFVTEGGDPTQVGLMSSAERVSFLQRLVPSQSVHGKFVRKFCYRMLLQNNVMNVILGIKILNGYMQLNSDSL